MAQLSTYATRSLAKIAGVDSAGNVGLSPRREISILDYLTANEQADVIARTGNNDLAAAIDAMLAEMESGGNLLKFPAGRYVTTGGHEIEKPFRMVGEGGGAVDGSSAITQIDCSSASAVLFTSSALFGSVANLGLRCTNGSPTSASRLFFVTHADDELAKVDFDGCLFHGSYDQLDIGVGSSWVVRNNLFIDGQHWGIRVRNTLNADAGDALIIGNWIYPDPDAGALAGIKWEDSGGLKIIGNKIISNNATDLPNGIHFDALGGTVEWLVLGNHIDTGDAAIKITSSPPRGNITGNFINVRGGTDEAIEITQGAQIMIGPNVIVGTDDAIAPITFGNVQDLTVMPQQVFDFSASTLSYLGTGTPARIRDLSRAATFNTFDPGNAKGSLAFSNGNLTVSATTTSATGAVARALRGGFQGSVYCEFTFTTIGSAGGSGVGIMNEDQDPHLGHYLGDAGNDSIGYYGDGNVWLNNSSLTTLATYTTNDVISVFVNFAKKLIFFRKNGGNWNNNASCDPETGALGIDISALFSGSQLYPAIDIESSTGVCVANFGASAYAQTPPDNGGNW